MVDEVFYEKELQVADARRKLAWFMEEYREIESSPVVKEHFHLMGRYCNNITSQEKARLREIENLEDLMQYYTNVGDRQRALTELQAAEKDLQAYRRANNIALQASNPAPIQKKPPENAATNTSDGKSPSLLLTRGCLANSQGINNLLYSIYPLYPLFTISIADCSANVVVANEESGQSRII